jgi:hypothetical protein
VIAARRIGPADELAATLRARNPDRVIETCALDAAALTAEDLERLRTCSSALRDTPVAAR